MSIWKGWVWLAHCKARWHRLCSLTRQVKNSCSNILSVPPKILGGIGPPGPFPIPTLMIYIRGHGYVTERSHRSRDAAIHGISHSQNIGRKWIL